MWERDEEEVAGFKMLFINSLLTIPLRGSTTSSPPILPKLTILTFIINYAPLAQRGRFEDVTDYDYCDMQCADDEERDDTDYQFVRMIESRSRSNGADDDYSFARLESVTLDLHGREMTASSLQDLVQIIERNPQIRLNITQHRYIQD